jgi:FtsH-binding integral membrane protein
MNMAFSTAGILFAVYAILNGVTMSILFFVYTAESIATTFFVTAGMFGAMGLLGYFTKKDLSTMGRFLIMALIGLIIATIVNIFWANSTLYWITTYAGILIFAGLTAYDTQKIKNMLVAHGTEVNDSTMKLALLGSLDLYLDFINLFIYLLRIFGNKK